MSSITPEFPNTPETHEPAQADEAPEQPWRPSAVSAATPDAAEPIEQGERFEAERTRERNLGVELVRVTEAAAYAAARWMGRGDKERVDQAAVDAMRNALEGVDMRGVVVIGEGEKDEAPMLYVGEEVGNGLEPEVDVAVDPVDGTRLAALGLPGSIAVVATADRGAMFQAPPGVYYMRKLAVGRAAASVIDLDAPVAENLRRVARARSARVEDLTVTILDRPRHEQMIREAREAGARVRLLTDGDVAAAIHAVMENDEVTDVYMGIGGAPEAVLAAAALKCVGGQMLCRICRACEFSEKQENNRSLHPDGFWL